MNDITVRISPRKAVVARHYEGDVYIAFGEADARDVPTSRAPATKLITVRFGLKGVLAKRVDDDQDYYEAVTTPIPGNAVKQAIEGRKTMNCADYGAFLRSVGAKEIDLFNSR